MRELRAWLLRLIGALVSPMKIPTACELGGTSARPCAFRK
jgi:hypothetical protein